MYPKLSLLLVLNLSCIAICFQHLLLCNFGATSGATRESIVDIFTSGSPVSFNVESVSLLPRKSFSFVTLRDAGEAREAVERLNGVEVDIAQGISWVSRAEFEKA